MRVLIVCSGNKGEASPFVRDQAEQLAVAGCDVQFFLITGKGWRGYLSNRSKLLQAIRVFQPVVLHAHSGMSALLAGLQIRVPVVATFHGSDVNVPGLLVFTRLAMLLSKRHIVVSPAMKSILNRPSVHVIPCAVDMNLFRPRDYAHARTQLGWKQGERYILFSSSFANTVKNAPLAQAALAALHDDAVHLVELKDRSREEVALLLNACDAALMTSFTEGSPQFIKEAMACGAPVVATRVGDVEALIEGLQGHFLTKYDAQDIAHALEAAMQFRRMKGLTAGSSVLLAKGLDPAAVIGKILSVYRTAIAH